MLWGNNGGKKKTKGELMKENIRMAETLKFHKSLISTSGQSLCLKNGSTDANIETCHWKGRRHGNSICIKVNWVEMSTQKAPSHGLKVFVFMFPDGFHKKYQTHLINLYLGAQRNRWLKTGHQTPLFAVSDIMENKKEGQGEFCKHLSSLEHSARDESIVMGLGRRGADITGPQFVGISHTGVPPMLLQLMETAASVMELHCLT